MQWICSYGPTAYRYQNKKELKKKVTKIALQKRAIKTRYDMKHTRQ